MEKIFLEVLNISISAGCMVPAVIMARFLFRKAPKGFRCFLWMLVGIRLLLPFSMESVFGLAPDVRIREESVWDRGQPAGSVPEMEAEKAEEEFIKNGNGQAGLAGWQAGDTLDGAGRWDKREMAVLFGTALWCAGVLAMGGYFIYSWHSLRRRVGMAVPKAYGDIKIYSCDEIATPFLFGIVRPRIYVPMDMEETDLPYIVEHENAHRRRKDHLTKMAAFCLLAVHWFNPCIWIVYKMLCSDIEFACDEWAVRDMSPDDRRGYVTALLKCAACGKTVSACPVAFGEAGIKERVKNVMNDRKPAFIVVLLGVIVGAIILLCFMTTRTTRKDATLLMVNRAGADNQEQALTEDPGALEENREEWQPLPETLPEKNGQEEMELLIKESMITWVQAFCDRDGKTIRAMISDEYRRKTGKEEMIPSEENEYSFGWSSPWPWDKDSDISILEITGEHAEILYYAWSSDPHVTVWRESLSYHVEDGKCYMDRSDLEVLEAICMAEEFYKAYPDGIINGTPMDYLNNGAGEALNRNALLSSSNIYRPLFEPDTAAIFLLNLLNNKNKVETTCQIEEESGNARVSFRFLEDGSTAAVTMVQPYGGDGIWIPQTDGEAGNGQ